LIRALGNEESKVRTAAAEALRRIGDSAVPALIEALGDEDPTVRERAVEGLDHRGWQPGRDENGATYWIARREWDECVGIGAPAVGPLAALLQDGDSGLRQEAARTLGSIGDAGALEPLLEVLKVEDVAAVRRRVREAIETIGEITGVELPSLEQPRVETVDDVEKARTLGHVRALVQALSEHRNFLVRQEAAWALGELGDERAVSALFAALDDDAVNVQNNAGDALVKIGGPEVIGGFIGMMAHVTERRKQAVASALSKITGERFGTNHYRWRDWWKGQRQG
jgi:HEAT repeat protein